MTLRSANVTQGAERAPNRSLFYAMGYTKEELDRPLIGVVSAHSEIVPGHAHLDKVAEAVKAGIRMAGGTPIADSLNRCLRRNRDGAHRDEVFSGEP